jgi:hypothetical protein
MECIYTENPMAPKIPWKNKVVFEQKIKELSSFFNSFSSAALAHWTKASQEYLTETLRSHAKEPVYSISKKFSHAIQFLDFGLQIVKTGKITDFSLFQDIRTRIDKKL